MKPHAHQTRDDSRVFRVALLGIYHESNTFVPEATTIADFQRGCVLTGGKIREEYERAHHEIGGMLEVMDREGVEVVPVLFASATPGGALTAETAHWLVREMLDRLQKVLPVDACLVVPHGAGVAEGIPDLDGYWLSEVRRLVGDSVPIVGTLDLHANVSQLMVSSSNLLVAYRENPHLDMRQRGIEAANLLVDALRGRINPVQALVQVPLAISIEMQSTVQEPCCRLQSWADQLRCEPGILAVSIQFGFPYADVEEMGTSIIVGADGDEAKALETARVLEGLILSQRDSFVGVRISIETALALVESSEKPVLLLDMGDNVGGGGPGNSLAILEAFEASKTQRYFVCLYDPGAVSIAGNFQPGQPFELKLTGTGGDGIESRSIEVTLLRLTNGEFVESSPRHGGQTRFNMGPTAVVRTAQGSVIMLTSRRVMPFSLQQLLSQGVDPADFDAIIAKGVNAPLAAYAPVCPTIIQVDTPGVTQADMTRFHYHHRRRPLFPFEQ
ncbi:MAG: M81 family peptidase [Acidobacteria bacterium]|nr:M81 family peptidase [Acidobacteriota bacterium]